MKLNVRLSSSDMKLNVRLRSSEMKLNVRLSSSEMKRKRENRCTRLQQYAV